MDTCSRTTFTSSIVLPRRAANRPLHVVAPALRLCLAADLSTNVFAVVTVFPLLLNTSHVVYITNHSLTTTSIFVASLSVLTL